MFFRTLFGAHPYGHPVLGTPSSVGRLAQADVRAFHEAHYGPSATTLVLSGDITEAAASALLDAHFGAWTAHAKFNASVPPAEPPRL